MENDSNNNATQEIPGSEQRVPQRHIVEGRIIGTDEINRDQPNGRSLINRLRRGFDLENPTHLTFSALAVLGCGLIGMGSIRRPNNGNDDDRQINNMMQTIQTIGFSTLALSLSCGIYICNSILNSNANNNQEIEWASRLRLVVNPDNSIVLMNTRPMALETPQNQNEIQQV